MHQDPTSGQLICQKHPNQIPTPWYKVFLVLEDETDEISALIIGRSGEKVFGVPCKDLVFNQRSVDQKQLPISSSSTPIDIIADSPVDIIADSHKRKRESIRRALFIPSKTSEAEEICETDAQDQDQVPIKLFKRKSSPTSSKTDFAPYKKN
ncbi:uncharacterized protein LOC103939968 isoform X2 [Pyrus x bretschneideri]|uniref:uncharacterized protein LOC103939968 isoform X2 n=1 Tax=Pyrus x bretschneideri TaxID=225117 RepID=UPI00202FFC6F|nr:uncharacterized protein LOC103939968 isoform X2 [Pyrus x bretschneideri]